MKRYFLVIASFVLAMASCESDADITAPQSNNGFIPANEQQALVESTLQQAVNGYDVSSFKPLVDSFFDCIANDRQLFIGALDSLTSVPSFKQLVLEDTIGSKLKLSLILTDSLSVVGEDTTLIVTPHATGTLTQDALHSLDIVHNGDITNIKAGGWDNVISIYISDDTIRLPESIILSIGRNGNPSFELNVSFKQDKPMGTVTASIESEFDTFGEKACLTLSTTDGIAFSWNSYNGENGLADIVIKTDCDMNSVSDISSFSAVDVLSWLADYEIFRGIDIDCGLMDGKIRLMSRLSNPFENPRLVAKLIPLFDKDNLSTDDVMELIRMIYSYFKSDFMFEGYDNPQARLQLFKPEDIDVSGIMNESEDLTYMITAVQKIVEAVETKEMMIIVSTIMSIYPGFVDAVKDLNGGDGTNMGCCVHVLAADVKDELDIPVDEYIDTGISGKLIYKPISDLFVSQSIDRIIYSIMSVYPSVVDLIKKNFNID